MQADIERRYTRVLEYVTLALVAFILLFWPIVSGYAFVHDEYYYCIKSVSGKTFMQNLLLTWQERQYRLPDLIAGYLCDPKTLDARWTMALQAPALAAIIWGIYDLAKRLSSDVSKVAIVASLWFMLHTATSVALWIPTVGQTWGGAAGIWLGLTVWRALERLTQGQSVRRSTWATLVGMGVIAPHLKETYYGWAGAITLAIAAVWLGLPKEVRVRSRKSTWFVVSLVVSLPPLLHLFARIISGGLARVIHGDQGRYSAQLGLNVFQNILLSLAGEVAVSPVHYARRSGAIQLVAYAGILLSGALVFAAMTSLRSHDTARAIQARKVALIAATSLLAVSITWPMGRISELYLMGPNAGMAVVAAMGAVKLLELRHTRLRRLIGGTIVLAAFAVGALGFVSRAIHFRTTWRQGRQLYADASNFQAGLPPSDTLRTICVPLELTRGRQHSQYVMPPSNALCPSSAELLLNELRPERKVKIVVQGNPDVTCDHVLDGSSLPSRISW